MPVSITDLQNFPNGLGIRWDDDTDSFIDYHILRDKCPCAHCSGESDIFGNVHKGLHIKKNGVSLRVEKRDKSGALCNPDHLG